jgi:hypothetical protein
MSYRKFIAVNFYAKHLKLEIWKESLRKKIVEVTYFSKLQMAD